MANVPTYWRTLKLRDELQIIASFLYSFHRPTVSDEKLPQRLEIKKTVLVISAEGFVKVIFPDMDFELLD